MIDRLLVSSILALALAPAARAETPYQLSPASTATFTAVGKPGFLRINGEGGKPAGTFVLDGTSRLVRADVKVPLADLTTGLDLRDEHMKTKYLDVAKYPDAVFHAGEVKLPGGALPAELEVPGKLTLHGATKPVTLALKLEPKGATIKGEGDFEVTLSDYGIDIPSFSGVTVAETVKVHCTFEATGGKP